MLTRAVIILFAALVAAPAYGQQPNVLVVMTDDQRADTVAWMPNVQELAAESVVFADSFVVNPLCCPSRATLLTGEWSHGTGVYRNFPRLGGWDSFRDDEHATIATALQAAGYRTGFVGKYLNRYDGRTVPPGWDEWVAFGPKDQRQGLYYDYTLNVNGNLTVHGSEPQDYSTDVLADHAARFLAADDGRPWFLLVVPFAPHGPATPAPRHARPATLEPYAAPSLDVVSSRHPRYVRALAPVNYAGLEAVRNAQHGALQAVDDMVGRLVGQAGPEAVVVFTSDNGFMWGEHRLREKRVPYEESIRVPLIVRGPWPARTIRGPVVGNVDVAPTVADLAGAHLDAEGRSLRPLLEDDAAPWRPVLLLEHGQGLGPWRPLGSWCGLRGPDFKYVQYATGEEELYDVAADPSELVNLADRPSLRLRLHELRWKIRLSKCRPPAFQPRSFCTRRGGPGPNRHLRGTPYFDYVCAGPGNDRIRARDGHRDVIDCGRGHDLATVDTVDRTIRCERVARG